ncbi:protein of unknown function [Marinospirillum celere]|uniref:DUF4426 domain-containing protein n=1 Tax=Marinospirillum celere TaxID=1122252 RepID=A0A1I1HRK2_9GAMM|nr:DUF4426 domain-containing protein [Marinospirillum celere]SFC26496.1 protein of unknown function [Marinospirillum celere]
MKWVNILIFAVLASLAFSAQAQTSNYREVGDYTIFYDVLPTTFLEPQLAQAYGLTRSRGMGLLRITVMKKDDGGNLLPVEQPRVAGQVGNLAGQINPLSFREVEVGQGDGYSTISSFRYSHDTPLRFNLRVTYQSGQPAEELHFIRRLYIE